MKNFIVVQLLKVAGKKLDGHKTQIGGVGSILMGILGIIGIMLPDQKTVDLSFEASIALIIAGLAALGIGGKLEKLKKVISDGADQGDTPPADQK